MKKTYFAHPLMIFRMLKPFLFILIFPVLKGGIQYIRKGEITGVLSLEIIALAVILLIAFLRYRAFRLIIEENSVILRTGIVFVRQSVIPRKNLSSIQTNRHAMDVLFGAVTFIINTEAGPQGKPDFEFKLRKKDSETVSEILIGKKEKSILKVSAYKVALMAATSSSAVTGLIVSVPVINRTGKLLGIAISNMLFDEINNVTSRIGDYFPPVVNTITIVFIFGYLMGFISSLLRNLRFELSLSEADIEIKSGIFVRRRISFKKTEVNDVRIEQTPLMRLIRRYSLKVSIGGYGDSRGESAVVIPSDRPDDIRRQFSAFFPFLVSDGAILRSKHDKTTRARFMFLPRLYAILIAAVTAAIALLFRDFARVAFFLGTVLFVINFYYGRLSLIAYRHSKIQVGDNIFAQGAKGFRNCELYCAKEKVGQIKLVRWPVDFKYKTCKVSLIIRSERADSIKVKHLDYGKAVELIEKCYGIKNIDE